MRLDEAVEEMAVPSTSSSYAPYKPPEESELLFGYPSGTVIAPWVTKRYRLSLEGLHQEIMDVYHWLRPSELEFGVRMRVFEKVRKILLNRFCDYDLRIEVFGSLRTKLFLPTSDIDILVECDHPDFKDPVPFMKETAELFSRMNIATGVQCLTDTSVPIIKMTDVDTQISIDISVNTVQGIRAVEYIEKVKQEFPVIEPLVLILKQFLIQRNLNSTFCGGLSSYGLILMLISFLQIQAMSVRRKALYNDGVNLGELLMRFFEVYAHEFNDRDCGISVNDCGYFLKSTRIADGQVQRPFLSIIDPLLSTNEVGKTAYNYLCVKRAFGQAHRILSAVLVRDRPRSTIFSNYFSGSIMSYILPFSVSEVYYRNWLKGFVMYRSRIPKNTTQKTLERNSQLLVCTALSPPIDMDSKAWYQALLKAEADVKKEKKVLDIVSPEDAERARNEASASEPSSPAVSDSGKSSGEVPATDGSSSSENGCKSPAEAAVEDRAMTPTPMSQSCSSSTRSASEESLHSESKDLKMQNSGDDFGTSSKPDLHVELKNGCCYAGGVNGKEVQDKLNGNHVNGNTCSRTPSPSENRTPPDSNRSGPPLNGYLKYAPAQTPIEKKGSSGAFRHSKESKGYIPQNGYRSQAPSDNDNEIVRKNGYQRGFRGQYQSPEYREQRHRPLVVENHNFRENGVYGPSTSSSAHRPPAAPSSSSSGSTRSRNRKHSGTRVFYKSNTSSGPRSSDGDSSDRDSIKSGGYRNGVLPTRR